MSGPTICIGGFCFPVYALIPIALIFLQSAWEWIRKNMLGINDTKEPDNTRVIHITSAEQFKEQLAKSKDTKRSLVVDFTASWCGPCRFIGPIYHDLSVKYPCTIFLKVDVDEMKSIASAAGVSAMPTFQFFRNGAKCDEMRGADRKGLEDRIQKFYVEVELPDEDKPKAAVTEASEADSADGLRQRKPKVTAVTSVAHWEKLLTQNREANSALVVAFAATWSKGSEDMLPVFERLSCKFPSAVFASVDVDELEDIVDKYEVSQPPTFKVFKRGEVVDELAGAIRSALESLVVKHAAA